MEDFDFIKEKFDNENITAPNSLNEDNIKALIETGAEPKVNIKLRNNKPFKAVLSLVACFAVLIVSITSVNAYQNSKVYPLPDTDVVADSNLITFNSYDEIEKQIKKLEKNNNEFYYTKGDKFDLLVEENVSDGIDTDANANHSDTNIQVDGVDEADIVKTDGKYIYRLNADLSGVKIFEVNGLDVKQLSFVNVKKNHLYVYTRDMYLLDNKLVVLGYYENYNPKTLESSSGTIVNIFDITDRAKPTLEYEFEQSGMCANSRMIGGILYVVSNYYVNSNVVDSHIPKVNDEKIECDCIVGVKKIDEPSFVVVSAIDVNNHTSNKVKTKAILGGTNEIYCSTENLYVICTNYNWYDVYYKGRSETTTDIIKISFDKTKLDVSASAVINGSVNNQYSLNEKDGNFFVAVTTQTQQGDDINTLYILDESLNQISSVNGFAKNEHIEAVRYIGNYAYVITYEQTDPLFVIDLTDVKNPQIKGSVKIDGFSTSLIPVDENTLLGVGNYVEKNVQKGIKFVLFDISNPEQPKVKAELEYPLVYSSAQYDIKAITFFGDKLAVPVYRSQDDGILVLDYKNELKENKMYIANNTFNRVVQINNYLYGINQNNADIEAFRM